MLTKKTTLYSLESDFLSSHDVVSDLKKILSTYLSLRPKLSVNALSKECCVSEPTLRRVLSGKVKTTPQTSTVLDILTYVSGTSSIRQIVEMYPGAIATFLKSAMPFIDEIDSEYSSRINEELKDPVKYLIFKLCLNNSGVSEEKIKELYGEHGIKLLHEMMQKEIVEIDKLHFCYAKTRSYSGSAEDFVRNFKLVADFIKPHKFRSRLPGNPFQVNCSDSINSQAYEKIVRLQRQTQKKIRKILSEDGSKGDIPFFQICAIDTLDPKAAFEFTEGPLRDEPPQEKWR